MKNKIIISAIIDFSKNFTIEDALIGELVELFKEDERHFKEFDKALRKIIAREIKVELIHVNDETGEQVFDERGFEMLFKRYLDIGLFYSESQAIDSFSYFVRHLITVIPGKYTKEIGLSRVLTPEFVKERMSDIFDPYYKLDQDKVLSLFAAGIPSRF